MTSATPTAQPEEDVRPAPGSSAVDRPDDGAAPGRFRRQLHATVPGCWGALLFASLSFTPSLLPRDGLLQGIVCGVTAAIGYGLGVLAASICRAIADRDPRPPRPMTWRVLVISAVVLFGLAFALGQYWQSQIRSLMGITDYNVPLAIASPLIAALVFAVFVLIGRGLRALYRWTARLLDRWIGRRAATAFGWILVVALTILIVTGVLLDGLVSAADKAFSVRDTMTEEGVNQPTSSLRSGGPGSVVAWETLGRQGRKFTGIGPTASDIEGLVHAPAMLPIRAYAGLGTAEDTEERAIKAVDDLERAGGFQRANLLVVTTTGSGWVDPAMIDSFEYLSAGNAASVAIQYSYLPSWISYLVDQSKAREAGRTLFDVVYDRWSRLPQGQRPTLYVAGESLGSFGGETAFSGEADLRNRTAGTLFAGPPNFNTLFRDFSDNRDVGSPEAEPIYKNGRTVRFAADPASGIPPSGQPWDGSRVLYLMHASDPIVWWSPHLIFNKPDWIGAAPGKDVLEDMVWMPFVTFWQVSADLPFSTGVPGGHGHKYTTEQADGWSAVMQPAGFTPATLDALKQAIARDDD